MYLHLTQKNNAVGKTDKNLSWETKFHLKKITDFSTDRFCRILSSYGVKKPKYD